MKNTVKLVSIVVLSLASIITASVFEACTTMPPGSNQPPSQANIDAAAVVLRGVARAGALAAITPPTGQTNNAAYFAAASDALGTFISRTNYTPGALQQDLLSINVPVLHDVYVQIAIGSVVDLYQLYYGQYVQSNLASNAPVVVEFATAIQDGFNQALGRQVLSRSIGLKSAIRPESQAQHILPRPCPR